MTCELNANAKEWIPPVGFADFSLPNSAVAEAERLELGSREGVDISIGSASGSPPPEQYAISQWNDAGYDPPPYFPSFLSADGNGSSSLMCGMGGITLEGIDWKKEFDNVMALTRELIERQLNVEQHTPRKSDTVECDNEDLPPASKKSQSASKATPTVAALPDSCAYPSLPGCDVVRPLPSGKWANAASVMKVKGQVASLGRDSKEPNDGRMHGAARAGGHGVASNNGDDEVDEAGKPLPPLTANGNRRWKKPTKAQQKKEAAQKNAFEAFANALLHSVSPFMVPLRERCKTSLPHIKVDQRFGKVGQPHTAVAQFVVAPLVTNYRPRHFHDLTPGDLMEFHYDFAQVLKQLKSAEEILFGYGPVWKRYAVPFCYVNCKEYREEVLRLCPDEVPNMRVEAIYEDDVVKDITDVVLSVEELEPLRKMSFIQAMGRRLNLAPLFDAFDAVFQPLDNYRIIIRGLHSTPSTYLIQTSQHEVNRKPQPLVLYNDPRLWYDLPVVSRVKVESTVRSSGSQSDGVTTRGETAASSSSAGLTPEESRSGKMSVSGGAPGRRREGVFGFGSEWTCRALVPLVGSAACVVLTAAILWRRRRAK